MSENKLNQFEYIIREDLQAYLNGLEQADFEFCNVISNRMITNSIILNLKTCTLLGVILKEITYEFRFYKDEKTEQRGKRNLKNMIKKYISNKIEIQINDLISDYLQYYYEFRELTKIDFEIYEENLNFSQIVINYCLKFFIQELEKNDIPLNLNLLIFGVLNEINRVIKSHGCKKEHLMLKIILNSFGRMYEYYRFFLLDEKNIERWSKKYSMLKAKLVLNLKKFIENDSYIEESQDFLFEICEEWRLMFIRMLEIPKISMIEKKINIPEKVKEDLNEIVSDLIRSKLEGEKND
ncbi:MAG: hypothetical protein ACTSXH_00430 [Promethearchaeota archaeon]